MLPSGLKSKVKRYLQQGQRPDDLAWSIAIGSALGLFPVPGMATLLCALAGLYRRLNPVVLQAFNYAVYPLQIGMLGIYYALGNIWFVTAGSPVNLNTVTEILAKDVLSGVPLLLQAALPIVTAWLLTSPLLVLMLFMLLRPILVSMQTLAGGRFACSAGGSHLATPVAVGVVSAGRPATPK
jgi:hypothetical protein